MVEQLLTIVVRSSMLIVEPMETNVYTHLVDRLVTYTYCQVSRNIACNLLAILVFSDSFGKILIKMVLQCTHSALYILVAQHHVSSSLWHATCDI